MSRIGDMERNKATIVASGIDPSLKQLRRLQAIRSSTRQKYVNALEDIEKYWDRVFAAVNEKEGAA